MQGLFILLFFTCSKKVVNSVKERLFGQAEVSTWHWSSRSKDQVDSQVPRVKVLLWRGAKKIKLKSSCYRKRRMVLWCR
jgi:hypothetical protein